jgi:RNA polymerase sigma factor (sigma-70 family)
MEPTDKIEAEMATLVATRGGDRRAWNVVAPRLLDDVKRSLREGNPRDAEDFAQEATWRAWQSFEAFLNSGTDSRYPNLLRYARTIAANLARDRARRLRTRLEVPEIRSPEDQPADHADPDCVTPEDAGARREQEDALRREVDAAMGSLSPHDRLILTRTILDEEAQKDLSAALGGTSHAAIRKQKERATKRLLGLLVGSRRHLIAPGVDEQLVDAVVFEDASLAGLARLRGMAVTDRAAAPSARWPALHEEIVRLDVGLVGEGVLDEERCRRIEASLERRLRATMRHLLLSYFG